MLQKKKTVVDIKVHEALNQAMKLLVEKKCYSNKDDNFFTITGFNAYVILFMNLFQSKNITIERVKELMQNNYKLLFQEFPEIKEYKTNVVDFNMYLSCLSQVIEYKNISKENLHNFEQLCTNGNIENIPPNVENLIGLKFNNYTIISFVDTQNSRSRWLCKCECGNTEILSKNYLNEIINNNHTKCQQCKSIIHNETHTPFWRIWNHIKNKIVSSKNPQYETYGGAGFTICKEWLNYSNFKKDMYSSWEKGLILITNTKDFNKLDCEWVNVQEHRIWLNDIKKINSRL